MQYESPERYFKTAQADRGQLDRIEISMAAMMEELAELKTQITREKNHGKRRKLKEKARQLEVEMRTARMLEE